MTALAGLDPRDAAARLLAEHDDVWVAELSAELDRYLHGRRLGRIMATWQLSRTELGALFGISRQAVSRWLVQGVPADRSVQVANVEAITELLERYLQRERIPAVVRRQAAGLDGRSLIEMVADGRSGDALGRTRRMFTFGDLQT